MAINPKDSLKEALDRKVQECYDIIAEQMKQIGIPKIIVDSSIPVNGSVLIDPKEWTREFYVDSTAPPPGIFKIPSPSAANSARNTVTEFCNYHGKRCKILSKDYQLGTATIQAQDVTGPYTLHVKLVDLEIENPRAGNKCTCGVDAVNGGRHSDWCDKFYKGE